MGRSPILDAPHFSGTVLGVLGVLGVLAKALIPRSSQAPTPATGKLPFISNGSQNACTHGTRESPPATDPPLLLQSQQWQIVAPLVYDAVNKNAFHRHTVEHEIVTNWQKAILVRN